MNNERNYFAEAGEFINQDGLTFQNIEERLTTFFYEQKFGQNEKLLFRFCLGDQTELKFTIASIKHECDKTSD